MSLEIRGSVVCPRILLQSFDRRDNKVVLVAIFSMVDGLDDEAVALEVVVLVVEFDDDVRDGGVEAVNNMVHGGDIVSSRTFSKGGIVYTQSNNGMPSSSTTIALSKGLV